MSPRLGRGLVGGRPTGAVSPHEATAALTQALGQLSPQSGVPSLCLGRPLISREVNWRRSEGAVNFLFIVKFFFLNVLY